MKEGNVLFNDALNTFYLRLYGIRHMVKDHSDSEKGLTARVLLYAPSHRQDNTYHSLCYTSRGALAGTRNSSMGLLCDEGRKCFISLCSQHIKFRLNGVGHSDSEREETCCRHMGYSV